MTEADAIENLLREGRSREQIHFVGNVMIDALRQFLPLAHESSILEDLGLIHDGKCLPFGVLTLHRPANVDSAETLGALLRAVKTVAGQLPINLPGSP